MDVNNSENPKNSGRVRSLGKIAVDKAFSGTDAFIFKNIGDVESH